MKEGIKTFGTIGTNTEIVDTLKSHSGAENPVKKKIIEVSLVEAPVNKVVNTDNGLLNINKNMVPDIKIKEEIGAQVMKEESGHEKTTKILQEHKWKIGSTVEIDDLSGNRLVCNYLCIYHISEYTKKIPISHQGSPFMGLPTNYEMKVPLL